MNSTNGTLLNDADAHGEAELVDGDMIRIGDTEFRFEPEGAEMLRVAEQAFRTDTGRQRNANEDSYFARAPIFVVADGMGGAQAGEVASKAAAEAFDRDLPDGSPERALRRDDRGREPRDPRAGAARPARRRDGDDDHRGDRRPPSDEVAIGHVGDSRAYRFRDGKLERLTRDHSLVEEMRRKGQLTDEQAEEHPQRSIITRALGPEPEVEVDVRTVPALPGDVFLLCSDGLTTMIGEESIAKQIAGATSLDAAVRALVDEANRAGGRDNITAVVFRVADAAQPAPDDDQPTLIGPSAEEEGFTAEEVRRRAGAGRGEEARPAARRRARSRCSRDWPWSSRSDSEPGGRTARSGSWAPTTAAGSRSTAACPTSCRSASSSTSSATRPRSRPTPSPAAAAMPSPATSCGPGTTPSP